MIKVLHGKYDRIQMQLREKDKEHIELKTEMYQLKKEMYEMNKDIGDRIWDKDQQIIEVTTRMTEKFEDLTMQLRKKDKRIKTLGGRLKYLELFILEQATMNTSVQLKTRMKQPVQESKSFKTFIRQTGQLC